MANEATKSTFVDDARREGYTEDEIQEYLAPIIEAAEKEGYSQKEIADYYGINLLDHSKANAALGNQVQKTVQAEEAKKSKIVNAAGVDIDTSSRIGAFTADIISRAEAVVSAGTGLVAGFPAYLAGGLAGLANRNHGFSDEDPKEVAARWAHAVTFEPTSEEGKRMAGVLNAPFIALTEKGEEAGHFVADKTGSAALGAVTEATVQMLPALVAPSLSHKLRGKVPTESDVYIGARDLAQEPVIKPGDSHAQAVARHEATIKEVEGKLKEAYEETGIDPALIADEARIDPVIKSELLSDNQIPFSDKTKVEPKIEPGAELTLKPEEVKKSSDGKPEPAPTTLAEAEAAIGARIALGDTTKRSMTFEDFYTALKDSTFPLANLEKAFNAGKLLPAELSATKLARLVKGVAGKATQFLEFASFDYKSFANTGPGLRQILKPLAKNLDGFRHYLTSKRVMELEGRGIRTGMPFEAARMVTDAGNKNPAFVKAAAEIQFFQNEMVRYMKDSGLLSEKAFNEMVALNQDYVPFHRLFLDEGAGGAKGSAGLKTHNPLREIKGDDTIVLDPMESIIKNAYVYISLAEKNAVGRALGDMAAKDPALAKQLGVSVVPRTVRPIRLEAAELQKILDEFVTVSRKTTKTKKETTTTADGEPVAAPSSKIFEKNKARVVEALTARGFSEAEAASMIRRLDSGKTTSKDTHTIATEVVSTENVVGLNIRLDSDAALIFRENAMRPAPNQIRYFEDGKPVTLEVPPNVAEVFNALDRHSVKLYEKVLSIPARSLRAGAVLAPEFVARNFVRDQVSAFVYSENGYIPVLDFVRGAVEIGGKGAEFQNWLKSGGANSALVAMDRQYLRQHLLDLNKQTGFMNHAINSAKTPVEILRIASELAENATRVGDFKKAKAKTKGEIQEAGFNSREVTQDFQRIGAQMQSLNMIATFLNASIEGPDRMVRAIKDNPTRTLSRIAVGVTVPSVALWAVNNRDEETRKIYREIPAWDRRMNWHFITPEYTYRMPKPHDLGVVFGSTVEVLLDKFVADDPNAGEGLPKAILDLMVPDMLPSAIVPGLEQYTNSSMFRDGQPLIPRRLEGLVPALQHTPYTTELAKAVGDTIGSFPGMKHNSFGSGIVVENWVRGWTGTLGVHVMNALDAGLRSQGLLPDPPKPLATLADIPFVKAFVVRYPSATAQSLQNFHNTYRKRKSLYDSFQERAKRGDVDAVQKMLEVDPETFSRLDSSAAMISDLNSTVRMVFKNPDMTPTDKRQLIDTMYHQMILTARVSNEVMRQLDEALGDTLTIEVIGGQTQ